jgi:hypothetical protein
MAATTVIGADKALPRFDVLAQAGRELELVLTVKDANGADVAEGTITAAVAQVRPDPLSAQLLHVFDSDADPASIVIDGATLTITATSRETSLWQANWPTLVAWWDIEITDAQDLPHQITAPGVITLNPEVTR